jgi:hypothetical protein
MRDKKKHQDAKTLAQKKLQKKASKWQKGLPGVECLVLCRIESNRAYNARIVL